MQLYTQLLPLSAHATGRQICTHAHTKEVAILSIPIRPTLYTVGQFFRFNCSIITIIKRESMGLNMTIRSVSSLNPNLYNSLKYYIVTYVYLEVIASDALMAYVHSDPVDEAKVVY